MRLYIAGPITGLPNNNRAAFEYATRVLRAAGYKAENPLWHASDAMSWEECMRCVLPVMLRCDGVALLSGWQKSKGARIEAKLAIDLDIPVQVLTGWL